MPRYGHRHWPKVWITLIALDTAVEIWALRHSRREATLSWATRQVFRTHTPIGRFVFSASWMALSGWLLPHIISGDNCVDDTPGTLLA